MSSLRLGGRVIQSYTDYNFVITKRNTTMTDFETAMLSFLQDAQNEFNCEKEVERFIGKHAPK